MTKSGVNLEMAECEFEAEITTSLRRYCRPMAAWLRLPVPHHAAAAGNFCAFHGEASRSCTVSSISI